MTEQKSQWDRVVAIVGSLFVLWVLAAVALLAAGAFYWFVFTRLGIW